MPAAEVFNLANLLALSGWASLVLALLVPHPRWGGARLWGGWVVPALLAGVYAASFWQGRHAQGGFDSLQGVGQLFQEPSMLLAGWVHYLAFDLFVGHWQVKQALLSGAAPWSLKRRLLVLPCLGATFWVGPLGLLLFLGLHGPLLWRARSARTHTHGVLLT